LLLRRRLGLEAVPEAEDLEGDGVGKFLAAGLIECADLDFGQFMGSHL